MILVVGATGQLGTAVVRRLRAEGMPVRAFVRPGSAYEHLTRMDVDLAFGDLRDARSVDTACEDVDAVVATASTLIPRNRDDSFESVEVDGYGNLVGACERHDVGQFVYVSVPVSSVDAKVPQVRYKRFNERRLMESGLDYTVVRAAPFVDVWFSLVGSSVPLRGAESPTLERAYWFTRLFRRVTGTLVENRGRALIPGEPENRHAFVTVDDVATFCVRCLGHREAERAVLEFGGPEVLTWKEVVDVYGDVLGHSVRPTYVSARTYTVAQRLLSPVSEKAGNFAGMHRFVASHETTYDPSETVDIMPGSRTTVEEFLREKAAIPEASSSERRRRRSLPTGA